MKPYDFDQSKGSRLSQKIAAGKTKACPLKQIHENLLEEIEIKPSTSRKNEKNDVLPRCVDDIDAESKSCGDLISILNTFPYLFPRSITKHSDVIPSVRLAIQS